LAALLAACTAMQTTQETSVLRLGSHALALLAFAVAASPSFAQTPLSWNNTNSWPGGNVPGVGSQIGAQVTIPPNKIVLLDVAHVRLSDLDIQGTLIFDPALDVKLTCDKIRVTGEMRIGTQAQPFTRKATIELRSDFAATVLPNQVDASLQVLGPGRFFAFGHSKGHTWTRLAAPAVAGSTRITLQTPVAWADTDEFVIAATDFEMPNSNLSQSEVRTVSRPAGMSSAILDFAQGLSHDHSGATVGQSLDGVGVELRAEVGLLSHNIVIEGIQGIGGETRFEADHSMPPRVPLVQIDNVEFRYLGRAGAMGQYPIHFHAHETTNPSASGSYVMNSSIHHCYNRFVAIHRTDDVILAHNVAYDTIGHGYYIEDNAVTGCQLIRNLGVLVRKPLNGGAGLDQDDKASVFWLDSPDNIVIENAAASAAYAGFWLDGPESPSSLVPPWTDFRSNVSHSNFWYGFYGDEHVTPTSESVIRDCLAYKNRHVGFWIRVLGNFRMVNCDTADNRAGHYYASAGYQVDQVGRDGVSKILLQDSLVIGESASNPTRFAQYGPNAPATSGRPYASPLVGVEFYDGLVGVENCVFGNFVRRTVTFDSGATAAMREAGALSQIEEANPWAVLPNNYFSGCSFVNAPPHYLRTPVGTYVNGVVRGDAGIANTILFDKSASMLGGERYIVPKAALGHDPFLLPSFPATATLDPTSNAYIVTGTRYAQIDVNVGHYPNGTPVLCSRAAKLPAPNATAESATFTSILRGSTFKSTGALRGDLSRIGRYHTNAVVGDAYVVAFSNGNPVHYVEASLQGAAPGDKIILGIPMAPFDADSTICVKYNGVDGVSVGSAGALIGAGGGKYFYDGQTMWMVFELDPIGAGTSVHDSKSSTFRVLM
jgi:cell migration-inducing and hyaluronan-binding protein